MGEGVSEGVSEWVSWVKGMGYALEKGGGKGKEKRCLTYSSDFVFHCRWEMRKRDESEMRNGEYAFYRVAVLGFKWKFYSMLNFSRLPLLSPTRHKCCASPLQIDWLHRHFFPIQLPYPHFHIYYYKSCYIIHDFQSNQYNPWWPFLEPRLSHDALWI
jgi:hypothetical protein